LMDDFYLALNIIFVPISLYIFDFSPCIYFCYKLVSACVNLFDFSP
jgi:hypothetical protein